MRQQKRGARADYRLAEGQRTQNSASVADKFPQLKSLRVDFTYVSTDGISQNNEIKYTVNLANAKSVFRFDCPNGECVGGDFDLSQVLTNAYAEHRTTAVGETLCQGWANKSTIGTVRCQNVLRYKLSLGYEPACPGSVACIPSENV
jgi:hypothetical protein